MHGVSGSEGYPSRHGSEADGIPKSEPEDEREAPPSSEVVGFSIRLMDDADALKVYQNLTGELDPNIWDSTTVVAHYADGTEVPLDDLFGWRDNGER